MDRPYGLTDTLQQRVASADADVADERAAVAAAKRTVEAVGADGLLPASQVAEEVARRVRRRRTRLARLEVVGGHADAVGCRSVRCGATRVASGSSWPTPTWSSARSTRSEISTSMWRCGSAPLSIPRQRQRHATPTTTRWRHSRARFAAACRHLRPGRGRPTGLRSRGDFEGCTRRLHAAASRGTDARTCSQRCHGCGRTCPMTRATSSPIGSAPLGPPIRRRIRGASRSGQVWRA